MLNSPKVLEARAFTTHFDGIAREIITDIHVSLPFKPKNNSDFKTNKIHPTKALWDTGATNSAITREVANVLNLEPSSKAEVHHANGKALVDVYYVNIYLPNGFVIPFVRVTECSATSGNFGVLIGMDIITLGDFSLTNFNKLTTLSFRMPSLHKVDYVNKQKPISNETKAGRNDPCPCGSGKKYKHCHGINS